MTRKRTQTSVLLALGSAVLLFIAIGFIVIGSLVIGKMPSIHAKPIASKASPQSPVAAASSYDKHIDTLPVPEPVIAKSGGSDAPTTTQANESLITENETTKAEKPAKAPKQNVLDNVLRKLGL